MESHESRLTALEQQQAVLEERVNYRSTERAADFIQLSKMLDQVVDLRVNQRVLETRVAIVTGAESAGTY